MKDDMCSLMFVCVTNSNDNVCTKTNRRETADIHTDVQSIDEKKEFLMFPHLCVTFH